jgi:uncharacterized membrane protein YhaH (DUF805 family)
MNPFAVSLSCTSDRLSSTLFIARQPIGWRESYSFMNWYFEVLKKYAVFEGRARRKEYWFFILFNLLISMALAFVDRLTGYVDPETGVGILSGLYALGVMLPGIAVSVRRLHDTGRSGWWLLITFVPVLGAIVFFYFMVLDSNTETNEYGPFPKGDEV